MEPQEMLELVDRHSAAEVARDLEAVMATVGAHPVYDFYPMNIHVEGRDAVRKLYEAVCANGLPPFTRLGTWTNESSVVSEDIIQVEGSDIRTISIFSFDDDGLLAGEAVFASEAIGGKVAAVVFDVATKGT